MLLTLARRARQVLRHTLGCQLPIEIIYNGRYEMDPDTQHRFEVGTNELALWECLLLSLPLC